MPRSAVANPNADPPLRTTASMRATRRSGDSRSHSRVAGAPPRTSPDATVPAGNRATVHPVFATGSVQCPTRTPGMSVITEVDARHAGADAAHDLIGNGVDAIGPLLGRDLVRALAPDEHDLVAGRPGAPERPAPVPARHVGVGPAVDHDLVHRDGACDRLAAAADEDLAAGE